MEQARIEHAPNRSLPTYITIADAMVNQFRMFLNIWCPRSTAIQCLAAVVFLCGKIIFAFHSQTKAYETVSVQLNPLNVFSVQPSDHKVESIKNACYTGFIFSSLSLNCLFLAALENSCLFPLPEG